MGKKIAAGSQTFDVSTRSVQALGTVLSQKGAKDALTGRIADRIHDTDGKLTIAASVDDLSLTEFEEENLRRILQSPVTPAWRLGEAFAECYLEDHHGFLFPWNTGRDLRNEDASQAGPDLVGFRGTANSARFAFGEAKTSEDIDCPPKVMVGRKGMIGQLEAINDDFDRRRALVRYLGFRHQRQTWSSLYKSAFRSYLTDTADFSLAGVLVRTTKPDHKDLQSRSKALSKNKPRDALLVALYLPVAMSEWQLLVFPDEGGQ